MDSLTPIVAIYTFDCGLCCAKRAAAALQAVISQIKSQYALVTDKPGVVHRAGLDGFLRLLYDMCRSNTEVLLIASNDVPSIDADLQIFRERLQEGKAEGISTREIFHTMLIPNCGERSLSTEEWMLDS